MEELKQFLNRNENENKEETEIDFTIPLSCWTFMSDCEYNCRKITLNFKCSEKKHTEISDIRYCCFLNKQ